jgi:hypothetical protein
MTVSETQTSGYDIRDAFYNVVTAAPFFANFTCRKNKMLPVQRNLIPYLGVYLVDEMMTPDGDANAGCIRFLHNVRIGFSMIQVNNDPNAAEQGADQAMQAIMVAAYTDLHLMNVLTNNNPESVGIEAITRGARRPVYGAPSTDNETPFVEMQYEISCSFRSEWYPDITDTLDEIDVTTYPNNDQSVTPVDVVYDFTSSTRRRPPPRKPWLLARDQNRRH